MKKCIYITPVDARYGFELAGFEQQVVTTERFLPLLKETCRLADVGLVIIDERLFTASDETEIREIEKMCQGVFIILPAPEAIEREEEDYAMRLIRRAIGYHVRVQL